MFMHFILRFQDIAYFRIFPLSYMLKFQSAIKLYKKLANYQEPK